MLKSSRTFFIFLNACLATFVITSLITTTVTSTYPVVAITLPASLDEGNSNMTSTGIPTAPATNASTISDCNCVIFRLDGVQDYHGKSAQLEIMDTFLNKSQSLSLGMIMNSIGNDTEIVNKILEGSKNGLFELSVLGWNFSDYSKMSQREQNTSLYLANQKVGQLFGQLSNVFIPPYGNFNKYTPSAMNNAGLEVLSSFPGFDNSSSTGSSSSGSNSSSNTNSSSNSSSSQYTTDNNNEYKNNTNTNTNNTNTNIYHFPAMISFSDYDNNGNIVKVPIQQILNETDFNISKYGYAVISLDTEFFINSQPQPQQQPQTSPRETTEEVKTQEIKDLSTLIDSILSKGISIQNFSKLLGLETIILPNKPPYPSITSTNNITSNNNTLNHVANSTVNETIVVHNQRVHVDTGGPALSDPNLKLERVLSINKVSTSMAFLSGNDILVLDRKNGTVVLILDGKILPDPILDLEVANDHERGLLGIAVSNIKENNTIKTYVYLYFTESGGGKDGDDDDASSIEPLGSRLYRYELLDNKLKNAKLLLDLPAKTIGNSQKSHFGGKVLIGHDQNLYLGIGDVGMHRTMSENNKTGSPPDGTGGILMVTQDGMPVVNGPFEGNGNLTKFYYAYGIRNTFGMDFDPVTGILWDTENGPEYGDEINIVRPGFNSGWSKIQGMSNEGQGLNDKRINPQTELVTFGGKGMYKDPEFVWNIPIGVTALKFFDSANFGKEYENTIFAGDANLGYLYNFKLNPQRTSLALSNNGPLADKVANTPSEMQTGRIIFGKGFGTITDIQVGQDGNLYLLNLFGDIFRISPVSRPIS